MQPILKWPGGKRFLAARLAAALGSLEFQRYIEPFAGGAASFFSVLPSKAVLADLNPELINFYECVKTDPVGLVRLLGSPVFVNTKPNYYLIRNYKPRTKLRRAARFYYLQRLSFNGIYRENLRGDFNVPYGGKTHLSSVDAESLLASSELLARASLYSGDFRLIMARAKRGDFVYADPPYTTLHNENGFIKYNQRLFSYEDQSDLAALAKQLKKDGVFIIISNANHASIDNLYRTHFRKIVISRASKIAASSAARCQITEALFISKNIPLDADRILCS